MSLCSGAQPTASSVGPNHTGGDGHDDHDNRNGDHRGRRDDNEHDNSAPHPSMHHATLQGAVEPSDSRTVLPLR